MHPFFFRLLLFAGALSLAGTGTRTAMYKVWIHYSQPIYARVSVKNGQTVRVTDWSYGKERSD